MQPPTQQDIEQLCQKAFSVTNKAEETSKHDDFAQGVYEALSWVLGKEEAPVFDEPETAETTS